VNKENWTEIDKERAIFIPVLMMHVLSTICSVLINLNVGPE
jgi:uncharacterized membrane protein